MNKIKINAKVIETNLALLKLIYFRGLNLFHPREPSLVKKINNCKITKKILSWFTGFYTDNINPWILDIATEKYFQGQITKNKLKKSTCFINGSISLKNILFDKKELDFLYSYNAIITPKLYYSSIELIDKLKHTNNKLLKKLVKSSGLLNTVASFVISAIPKIDTHFTRYTEIEDILKYVYKKYTTVLYDYLDGKLELKDSNYNYTDLKDLGIVLEKLSKNKKVTTNLPENILIQILNYYLLYLSQKFKVSILPRKNWNEKISNIPVADILEAFNKLKYNKYDILYQKRELFLKIIDINSFSDLTKKITSYFINKHAQSEEDKKRAEELLQLTLIECLVSNLEK